MARPKKDIDGKEVQKLAELQCTYEEIAAFFDCDKSTISRRFTTEVLKGREVGKISLRRKQFKLADTNGAVAIFLGKNYLNQRDSREIDTGDNLNDRLSQIASALEAHTDTETIPTGQSQVYGSSGRETVKKDVNKQT